MFSTIETRWFGQGRPPAGVLAWFDAFDGAAERESSRRDYYLRLTGGDDLGVKLREGALEVKQRRRSYGLVRLHRSIESLVEGWRKWRLPLHYPESPIASELSGHSGWLAVDKARQLRRYQVNSDMAVRIAKPQDPNDSGCTLELASVRTGDRHWWTVAFEVSGNSAGLYEQLMAVTNHLFALRMPPPLAATGSYGYPRWLKTINGND